MTARDMDSSFDQAIAAWGPFYTLAGSAAATLVGLLFVSVSVRPGLFSRGSAGQKRALASGTLGSFLYVLAIALVFLIPGPGPAGLGIPLTLLGLSGCVRLLLPVARLRRERNRGAPNPFTPSLLWNLAIPGVAYLTLVWVSVELMIGNPTALVWLVWVNITLLTTGARNAWELLIPEEQSTTE